MVDTATRAITYVTDIASSDQFQNAFYWPSVPAMTGSKIFMMSSNGSGANFGLAFTMLGTPTILPGLGHCGGAYNGDNYDGEIVIVPDWSLKSTSVKGGSIVQGYGPSGYSFLSFITDSGLSWTVDVPGSFGVMPPLAYDEVTQTIWIFGGTANNTLYKVNGGTLTSTGFVVPVTTEGSFFGGYLSDNVRGVAFDTNTGFLRILTGGPSSDPAHLRLMNPTTGIIVESQTMPFSQIQVVGAPGKMWDLPLQQKVIFSNGYAVWDIPYGTPLDPEKVVLRDIVYDISMRTKELNSSQVDVDQLTDLVDGFCITTNMTARAAIEPLAQAYFFCSVESDAKVKFVKRGGQSIATIQMNSVVEEGQ
jgi:hypothetical protein